MAKRVSLEEWFTRLAAARSDPAAPQAREDLARALESKTNLLAGKAAALIGELKLTGFAAGLVAAFQRFMAGPSAGPESSSDRGCYATTAAAKALLDTDAGPEAAPVYLAGVRHRQFDGPPDGGRPQDTAAALRGYCALGLLGIRHPDAMVWLTDLLLDAEPPARVAAARGLASTGREEAALLLRLRLHVGDSSGEFLAECMAGLLRLDPGRSLDLVAGYLSDPGEEVRTDAALALGESRLPAALEPLRRAFERSRDPDECRTLLLAIAMLRRPEATEFVLGVVTAPGGSPADAVAAVEALKLYRFDAAVRSKAEEAVAARGGAELRRAFDAAFGG